MAVGRTQAQGVSRSGLCCCQLRAWTWAAGPLAAFTSNDRARDVIRNFNPDGFAPLYPRYQGGRPPTFTLSQWREIKKIAASHPAGCAPPALAPLGCGTCSPPMSRARTICPGTSSRARPQGAVPHARTAPQTWRCCRPKFPRSQVLRQTVASRLPGRPPYCRADPLGRRPQIRPGDYDQGGPV